MTKIGKHIPCRHSMSTNWEFDHIKNRHSLYRVDYMKNFCESLREHLKNVTDYENKKILSLTKKELKIRSRCNKMLHF